MRNIAPINLTNLERGFSMHCIADIESDNNTATVPCCHKWCWGHVEWILQAFLTSERLVTTVAEFPANDKWLQVVEPVYYEQSDSLGKDLGPLKGVTGIMWTTPRIWKYPTEWNFQEVKGVWGNRPEKETTRKKLSNSGTSGMTPRPILWRIYSKDGVAPNNVKS